MKVQLSCLVLASLQLYCNSLRLLKVPGNSIQNVRSRLYPSIVKLYAKKKKLVSDEFLSSFDEIDEVKQELSEPIIEKANDENKQKKKKKKNNGKEDSQATEVVTESVIASEVAQIEESVAVIQETPVDTKEETVEQRVRREKPPSRLKFAESSQPGYVMMALENVGLVFGNEEILIDSSFSVSTGERVGLVGPNGSGKTTQLKILAGEVMPTTGTVVKSSSNLRVSYLKQEFLDSLNPSNTLREELLTSFVEERKLLDDITQCEKDIAAYVDDADKMTKAIDKLQQLQEQALSKGVYNLDSKVDKIMDNIGFSKHDAGCTVSTFSGGWKMRIGLAKILLQDPNIVLLDEPTNHLDLDSVFWLEDFLIKQSIPMVIVSHDREFLDRVCNKIVDMEDGRSVSYDGNYSKFLEQKKIRLEQWREKYEKQQKYIREEEKIIKQFRGDPSQIHVANAKESQLEKLKNSDEYIKSPPKERKFRFRFPPAPRCGQNMVEVAGLSHGYGNDNSSYLFRNVDLTVTRGDRIGFVGPNGAGKSTMMRIIAGREDPKQGYAEFASNNVEYNYFEQSTADSLDLDQTVFEAVQAVAPTDYLNTDIRTLLGQFMFKGDDADKKLSALSGGEKARVALCRMMLTPCNLLLLDEPTNHLDILSKEVLEEAIQHYDGSVIVISHDRYFMSQVANQIFSFEDSTVVRYDCDYHDYIHRKEDGVKEKIESRYVEGDSYRITNAKEVVVAEMKTKRNFGGSGVTGGNLNKGIKNAKRYSNQ